MEEKKPQIIKGLEVICNNEKYDKIRYLEIRDKEVYFVNLKNEYLTENVTCKLNEVKINIE